MKPQTTRIAAAALALLALLFAFHGAEAELAAAWGTEEYSHGPFIPLVALLLGWHFLAAKKPILRPSWWGAAWLALAALLELIAQLSAFGMAGQYGLLIALAGLCLGGMGTAATRIVAPALAYLIFAIPLPHLLQADLSQRLQLISSSLGVWPLDLMGIPVLQEGNVIDLGGYRLQVVEACSGLRYLFPLMSFGYLVALLLQDRWWKRACLFLSTIPISILLNALRIAIIGVTVDRWGPAMAEGFIHAFEGWALFLVCLLILLAEAALLLRIGRRGRFRYDYLSPIRGAWFGGHAGGARPAYATLALSLLLALAFGTGIIAQRDENIPAHPPFIGFPLQLGAWRGQPDRLPPDVLDALRLSDYWLADYREPQQAGEVNLYIAYYDSQRVGATTHSPANCIPGGGWRIDRSGVRRLTPADGQPLDVTRLLIRKGKDAELVYYWFDERGRDLTETTYAKWYLLWDSMLMRRSDGALVRLVTPAADGEDAADARLQSFLTPAWPALKAFIPGR